MLCRRARVGQRAAPVGEALAQREERVGGALSEQHRDVETAAVADVPQRAVLAEERVEVRGACRLAVGPLAGRGALGERGVDRGRQGVGGQGGRGQRGGPRRPHDVVRAEALVQVVPRDLGGQRVEDGLAAQPQLLEGAEELVPAAVAATDAASRGSPGPSCRTQGRPADQLDQLADVLPLVRRVLDVGLAAAGAEAALVEGQHAVPVVEQLLEGVGLVSRGSRPSRGCA